MLIENVRTVVVINQYLMNLQLAHVSGYYEQVSVVLSRYYGVFQREFDVEGVFPYLVDVAVCLLGVTSSSWPRDAQDFFLLHRVLVGVIFGSRFLGVDFEFGPQVLCYIHKVVGQSLFFYFFF